MGTWCHVGELQYSNNPRDFGYCRCIKPVETEGIICKIRRGITIRLDKIQVDFWKNAGETGIECLGCLMSYLEQLKC